MNFYTKYGNKKGKIKYATKIVARGDRSTYWTEEDLDKLEKEQCMVALSRDGYLEQLKLLTEKQRKRIKNTYPTILQDIYLYI